MEPSKQSDAADLEARLDAIAERVGDPSSPLLLNPQQELAAPAERPPPRMPQSPPKEVAPTATPDMLQPQPEAPSVELSPGDRIRKNTRDWLDSVDKPRFNAGSDAPNPSAAPKRSELNVNAKEFLPSFLSHLSLSTPSFSASQGQTSASARRSLTPEEDQALQHFRKLVPGDVDSAGSSACLVRSLKEGREVVRKGVLDVVEGALHFVMGSPEWSDVFVELLHQGSLDELQVIVDVACKSAESGDPLMRVADADSERGVDSLKELFKAAVKQHPLLRQDLVNCLLNDNLFCHSRGPDLIFATFPYEDSSSVVIQRALENFSGVLSSEFGSDSMVECFAAATTTELEDFEGLILSHIVPFAKGKYSNYFLQSVLEHGDNVLKESITDRVLEHLMSLSMDKYGSFVVQACFTVTGSARTLLPRVLTAFQGLSYRELARLVQDPFATHVVSELLLTGKAHFLDETMALAKKIQTLPEPAASLYPDQAVSMRNVMQAVREVLS
ncbi:unnamed protein product [Urochloa decumbens]|uniref:PUM-HD domain-containing protein n=1 Tax=Urochloa decumbens TaxID=240449 RepID=A0ABC8Y6I0_9POAL